jgi:hypothetical protein
VLRRDCRDEKDVIMRGLDKICRNALARLELEGFIDKNSLILADTLILINTEKVPIIYLF